MNTTNIASRKLYQEGNYTCVATSKYGTDVKHFVIKGEKIGYFETRSMQRVAKGWVGFLICITKCHYDQIFTSWFLGGSQRILWKNENAPVYHLQISALVPQIFKFEKCVKYANEMTDDVIHSTQFYIKYINRAILANLQRKPLKLGRLIVLQETHLRL